MKSIAQSILGMLNVLNFRSDELFSLNTTDYQTLLISVDKDKKQIQEEYNQLNQFTLNSNPVHNNTKYPFSYTVKSENITNTTQTQIGNTIIINNNINTFNYNLNFKEKKDFFKKRNRYNSSFDGIFNLFPNIDKDLGNFGNMQRKNCDDADYVNNFNCTFKDNIFSNVKNDFEDENDLEDLIMISNTPSNYQSRKVSCDTFFVDLMNIGNNA